MNNILTIDALVFILYFITPGVITIKTQDLIIPADQRNWGELVLELISYSALNLCIYYLFLAPLVNRFIPAIYVPTFISNKEIDYRAVFFGSFILPILVGFISSVVPRWARFQKFFRGIILHPEPTAWDALFADRNKCYVILFHFKSNDKVVAGVYGDKSYVSTFPHSKEIYVQQLCDIDNNGQIIGTNKSSAGAFISIDECTLVEFFHVPSMKRRKLWQRIKSWIVNSVSTRWPRNQQSHFLEKQEVHLQNPTLVASFRSEAVSSPSHQTQEDKEVQEIQPVPPQTQAHKEVQEIQPVPPQTQAARDNKVAK